MSISLINLLKRGDNGDLTFIKSLKHFDSDDMLKHYQNELGKRLRDASSAQWDIALTVANFVRSGAWVAYHTPTMELYELWEVANPDKSYKDNPYRSPGGMDYWCSSVSFTTFMRVNFGLCRTSVYNYLEVVDEFATYIEDRGKEPYYSINEEAKFYQFWQLIEMVSLTYQERKKIEPNWTREQIRAYKKELREKLKPKAVQPAEQIEAEEKPQTEAQARFAKYSKDDLINRIVELEAVEAALREEADDLLNRTLELEKKASAPNPFAADNVTDAKRDIQGCIESLLNSFKYEITLCGRKQGVKAFAGNIAKRIVAKYTGEDPAEKKTTSKAREVVCEQISITV